MATASERDWDATAVSGGVVVGDDGSAGAARAVTYAGEEAARRGVPLHVVHGWKIMTAPRPPGLPAGYAPSMTELAESARASEEARVPGLLGGTSVETHVHVPYGPAAQTLLAASEHATVLVVGARGKGGFASLVLGSVAEQVVRHASCPVVVVR